jgi:hypothetical protein
MVLGIDEIWQAYFCLFLIENSPDAHLFVDQGCMLQVCAGVLWYALLNGGWGQVRILVVGIEGWGVG